MSNVAFDRSSCMPHIKKYTVGIVKFHVFINVQSDRRGTNNPRAILFATLVWLYSRRYIGLRLYRNVFSHLSILRNDSEFLNLLL
jgi:hypothetical protein